LSRIEFLGSDVKTQDEFESFGASLNLEEEFIKPLLSIFLDYINELMQKEVEELAGRKYERGEDFDCGRWGYQWGSVYAGEQKVKIKYPRLRDRKNNKEVNLSSYSVHQKSRKVNELLLQKILHGISCRRYPACVEHIPEAFGMSSSTVSRRFIEASSEKLREFFERRLDCYDIVSIFIDGKYFHDDEMIIAVGITSKGEKVILGFIQAGTENHIVCTEFLEQLLDRGLNIKNGVLCVIDGGKGLRKAIKKVFGEYALIQRCQWHKRENVISYLTKNRQEIFKQKLQKAYEEPTYQRAKSHLLYIGEELKIINSSAYKSLLEGLEETLTLHSLGMFQIVGTSLKTTNCIESIMSLIGQKTDKVDCWKNSNQKHRWLATVLLDIEKRLKKIKGYEHLQLLRFAIKRKLKLMDNKMVA
jgi:transposase-like protein